MNCVEVRDRLTEHALGVLNEDAGRQVERHLEWCAGCRKEATELAEGAEILGHSLTPARPPAALEERVVYRLMMAAGRRPHPSRRRTVRVLVAATLAAAMVALGAVGWGFAERRQALNAIEELERVQGVQDRLVAIVDDLQQQFQVAGRIFQARLYPGTRDQAAGAAVVLSPQEGTGFIVVQVVTPLDPSLAPFVAELRDDAGHTLRVGQLVPQRSGGYVLQNIKLESNPSRPGAVDLERLTSISILDRTGVPVLLGPFSVSAAPTPPRA
jgi:predicted anti-sigma-YlaC factor YlaD